MLSSYDVKYLKFIRNALFSGNTTTMGEKGTYHCIIFLTDDKRKKSLISAFLIETQRFVMTLQGWSNFVPFPGLRLETNVLGDSCRRKVWGAFCFVLFFRNTYNSDIQVTCARWCSPINKWPPHKS